jgi:uncharacterized protein
MLGRAHPLFAFALAAMVACGAALAADVPYLSGRVVDNAEILSADAERRITARLKEHEDRTTDQIAVLTVPSLEGESIEEFAVKVFEAWKLGQKGKDNGVLVVVAPRDRKMRIEVGYGLEGTLTDLHASRIIRNVMTPRFKSGEFDGGVEAGVTAIIATLAGDAAAAPAAEPPRAAPESPSDSGAMDLPLPARIALGALMLGVIGLFTLVGVATPGIGWFMYLFLMPFWAIFPTAFLGMDGALWLLGAYLIGYPLAKLYVSRSEWYQRARREIRTKGRTTIGGFTIGSGGGGGGWSSGGGGGGFSGGGGSSGGGGASGSW